jgi:hypothetical protein
MRTQQELLAAFAGRRRSSGDAPGDQTPSTRHEIIGSMNVPRVIATPAEDLPRRFDPPHILWYFGAISAAFTANATVAETSSASRGIWQLLVALAFAAVFVALGGLCLRTGWWVPGGVLVTAAVAMVPAGGQAFCRLISVWPDEGAPASPDTLQDFEATLFAIGLATIIIGVAAFAIVRFPFIFLIVTLATIFCAQVLLPVLVDSPSADDHATTVLLTGTMLFLVAVVLDSVGRRGDAFWWHVVGLFGVAVGLTWYAAKGSTLGLGEAEWAWIVIIIVGGSILALSMPFARATWAVYGILGVYSGLAHYIQSWFGSWKETTVLVLLGLAVIGLGVALQLYAILWLRFTGRRAVAAHAPPEPPPPPATPPPPPPPAEPDEPPPPETTDEPERPRDS